MQKPKTQYEAVSNHLFNFGHITSWEAIKEYGITRLSHLIYRLRKEGVLIESLDTNAINRFGNKVTFATYKLSNFKK